MVDPAGFTLAVSQNKYLSIEDDEIHAIVTVTARDLAGTLHGRAPEAAEVIAVDCSGSMGHPMTKMDAARRASAAAIDALRDGVSFALIEGTHIARMVYPQEERLTVATPATKAAAKRAVRHLTPGGGTAMGAWLRLADRLLDAHPAAVRHVMLVTDGQNLPEYRQGLDDALADCQGRFVCDGRGIGDDYEPEELRRIASALRGTADAVLADADLVAEFEGMMRAAMSKVVPDVRLQLRTMPFTQVAFVEQKFPTESNLTELGVPIDARTTGFSTGSWSEGEEREFHVCLRLTQADLPLKEDVLAALVDLAIVRAGAGESGACGGPGTIVMHRTDNPRLSSVLDPKVAHYAGHDELAAAVLAGRDALDAQDPERAAEAWGRAVALAAGLADHTMLKRLARLVDVVGDPAQGEVRLKPDLLPREVFSAMLGTITTTRSPDQEPRRPERAAATGPDRVCELCDHRSPSTARFCEKCRHPWQESA